MKQKNTRNVRNRILYTILVVVLLISVFISMIIYAYKEAEESNFETLHIRTKEIKDDITLQMVSDRENLTTIASMAGHLYGKAEQVYAEKDNLAVVENIAKDIKIIADDLYPEGYGEYKLLFESFESIGLIDEIAILLPSGMLFTKEGVKPVLNMSYKDEAERAPYITGRVPALTGPEREVVRSSVPIISDGKTVGILYGIIELDTLRNRYFDTVDNMESRLYLVERANGDFIVDTWSDELGNLKDSKVLENKKGYSYDEMRDDIFAGGEGFGAYKSSVSKVFMYTHYSPMEIGDWTIVLSMPEDIVFKEAHDTKNNLMIMFVVIFVIMTIYIVFMFTSEIKFSNIAFTASIVRKHLLGVAGDRKGVEDALELIRVKCRGRTAFFADTVGNDFSHTDENFKGNIISGKDREYFHSELFGYIGKRMKESRATFWVTEVISELCPAKTNPKFYAFLQEHGINKVYIAAITDRYDKISILGITNSKRKFETKEILKEVAICFSISVHNKDHLDRTEYEAVTDALTGVSNRVAYKRDIIEIDKNARENFACIYIDVNELHTYNNKYGHAAGDEMLIYIADSIKDVFGTYHVYRMGGDEFLIFTEGYSKKEVEEKIGCLVAKVEEKGYHVSIGMNYSLKNIDTETSMRQAEKKMYDEKAKYYQQKELKQQQQIKSDSAETRLKFIETGDRDLDIMIKLLGGHYNGIYSVNLNTDVARRIIMPSYMDFNEKEESFSEIFKEYVSNFVHNDSQRGMFRFLNYDVLKGELANGDIPRFTYQKTNGEYHVLTVYSQGEETLWVFENA